LEENLEERDLRDSFERYESACAGNRRYHRYVQRYWRCDCFAAAVAAVIDRTGRIDAVVNNAGVDLIGAAEETLEYTA